MAVQATSLVWCKIYCKISRAFTILRHSSEDHRFLSLAMLLARRQLVSCRQQSFSSFLVAHAKLALFDGRSLALRQLQPGNGLSLCDAIDPGCVKRPTRL